jgi:hypothetical protein
MTEVHFDGVLPVEADNTINPRTASDIALDCERNAPLPRSFVMGAAGIEPATPRV